jgi:hypothetical protein
MRALAVVLVLTACAPVDPSPAEPLRSSLHGVWRITGAVTAAEQDSPYLDRLGPRGELLIVSGCEGGVGDCPDSLQGYYRGVGPRPKTLPGCDMAVVELVGSGDSVLIVLGPNTDHGRRELRGALGHRRMRGVWAGATYSGWLRGTFDMERMPEGSGLTRACSRQAEGGWGSVRARGSVRPSSGCVGLCGR